MKYLLTVYLLVLGYIIQAQTPKKFADGKYRYVNKQGEVIEKLGEWKHANSFYKYHLTSVTDFTGKRFLLDKKGNAYRFANNLEALTPEVEACGWQDMSHLTSIPPEILRATHLLKTW